MGGQALFCLRRWLYEGSSTGCALKSYCADVGQVCNVLRLCGHPASLFDSNSCDCPRCGVCASFYQRECSPTRTAIATKTSTAILFHLNLFGLLLPRPALWFSPATDSATVLGCPVCHLRRKNQRVNTDAPLESTRR
jgi:hypothetical protein